MALLPRDVRKALDVLSRCRPRTQRRRAPAICGVATRTLQKHFKQFLGRTPGEVLRDLRLERVRHELLCGAPDISVTERALSCGIKHLGRFAAAYGKRYGEKPSVTIRRRLQAHAGPQRSLDSAILSQPPLINVEPFAPGRRPSGRSRSPMKFPLRSCAAAGSRSARKARRTISCTAGSATMAVTACGCW